MAYQPSLATAVSYDASNRARVGQLTTLADLKTLNVDDPLLWHSTGTGLSAFQTNKFSMSAVTTGQYVIRQSNRYHPYFSGKSQQIEFTFDRFQTQANVTKRLGYFSSLSSAVYDTGYDGFWLEDDGTTKRIKASRGGTLTFNVPMSSWDNYSAVQSYNWSNFTVCIMDFLWLGGAILRFFLRTPTGLTLIHTLHYPGSSQDCFINSPNQPFRAEIRSTGGAGEMRPICCQISTEGSIDEDGKQRSVTTGHLGYTLTTVGTTYPILGVRQKIAQRDRRIKVTGTTAFVNSNDQLLLSIQLNPTITGAPTWADVANSAAQFGLPVATGPAGTPSVYTTTSTVTDGTILFQMVITQDSIVPPNLLAEDFLSSLGVSVHDISDEIWICGTPVTANTVVFGNLQYKEY